MPQPSPEAARIAFTPCIRPSATSAKRRLSQQALADCLFAGLGNAESNFGTRARRKSRKKRPSKQDAFEAYILSKNVVSLNVGAYRYKPSQSTLTPVQTNQNLDLPSLLFDHEWSNLVPAAIVLVANLEATASQYEDINAYVAAGQIAQKMMLAAARHGLSACGSTEIDHNEISNYLNLNDIMETPPIYALMLSNSPQIWSLAGENAGNIRVKN